MEIDAYKQVQIYDNFPIPQDTLLEHLCGSWTSAWTVANQKWIVQLHRPAFLAFLDFFPLLPSFILS